MNLLQIISKRDEIHKEICELSPGFKINFVINEIFERHAAIICCGAMPLNTEQLSFIFNQLLISTLQEILHGMKVASTAVPTIGC